MEIYIRLFLISVGSAFFSNIIITPILIILAKKYQWYDSTNERKIHISPTPRIGGVGVFISFIIGISVFFGLSSSSGIEMGLDGYKFTALLIAIAGIFTVGIFDDYLNLSAKLKFGIQALLTILLIVSGFRFKELYIPFVQYTLPLGLFSYPLTFIWIVGVSNAINLIDGMDGLAGGLSCLGLLSVGLYSLILNDTGLSVLAFTLAGSLLAFLVFNFPPAKIFMGDAGSYVIGLTLAVVPLANNPQYNSVTLYLAITVCIIPIFDTLSSMIRRMIFYRVSFFTPDKEHTHHKLLNLGLSTLQILVIVYLICCCLCGVTLLWSLYQTDWSLLLIMAVWVAVGIFFLALSHDFRKYFKNDPEAQRFYELKRQQQIKAVRKEMEKAQQPEQKVPEGVFNGK